MDESRRERKKRLTRQRITSAAIQLFDQQGYEATTVAQIAAAADVDTKTFFNYFGAKADVLVNTIDLELEVLTAAIAGRRPDEGPGAVLLRAVREYGTHRRPSAPAREPAELSAAARLALTTPALQARAAYLMVEVQQQVADELIKAFPDLDPVTAAAMTGSVLGAVQQAAMTSARLGRSQERFWAAAEQALDVAARGLLAAPAAAAPSATTRRGQTHDR